LNPTKRKQISQQTADKLGLDVSLVDDVVSFYFHTVQRKLARLDHVNVNVPNLGTFVLVKPRVESKLQRYEQFCEKVDESESIKAYETKLEVKHHIQNYKNALSFLEAESQRKTEVKQKKRQRYVEERDQSMEGAQ
jgi:nucleoid DNA-binding protein